MPCRLAVICACLLAALALPARAQWWNDSDPTPPKDRGMPWAPKVVYTHQMLDLAYQSANAAFWNERFEKLDRMYDEFLRDGIRTTDGTFLVESIGRLFNDLGGANEDLVKKAFATWAARAPQSKLRPVAEAVMWQARAWAARGGDYASSVPGESMKIFRDRLRRATQALEAAEPEGKGSPLWYWTALIVAGSSGQPQPPFDALFEEAVARKHDGDIFADTLVTWPKMKKGFEDMVARHPDYWNRNLFATFACRARDKETTGKLLVELGNNARLGAWSPGITTDSCRKFALIES